MLTILTILTVYNFIIPKVILLLISVILLKLSFLRLVKDHYPQGYEPLNIFKIDSFFINYFLVFIYIIIFLIILFILRLSRIGFQLDLKPFYNFILFYINQKEYLIINIIIIIILLLIIIIIILIQEFRMYLEIHLIKQHIYLSYANRNKFLNKYVYFYYERFGTYNMYRLFLYFFKKVDYFALKFFISYNLGKIRRFFKNKPIFKKLLDKLEDIFFILISLKVIMLLILLSIIYDIIYNNGIISILYNILPIFFIYTLWYRFSHFLSNNLDILNEILFDIYYNQPNIKYIGFEYQDNLIISLYIRSGLLLPKDFYFQYSNRIFPMLFYNKYTLIDKENNIYYNENSNKYIQIN